MTLVTFHPVSVNPATGIWTVCTRIRVAVTMRRAASRTATAVAADPLQPMVRACVINPGHDNPFPPPRSPRLLIVTEPQFQAALEPLIAWKTRSGLPVRTLIYSATANSPEVLRARIRQICDSLSAPPAYLLIVGDVDFVPAFYGVDNSLTDHPYSLRTDTDYLPDISVGRLPCRNASECEIWVTRLLAYERDAQLSPIESGTVFSSSVWYDPQHGTAVSNLLQSSGLTPVDRLQQPQTGSLDLLLGSLNAGRQWVFYIGHGSAGGWSSVEPDFTSSTLPRLIATSAPVVISVACATADLDYPGASFAEQWLMRPGMYGPIAYFGATENTAFLRSDTIGLAALRGVFAEHLERLGLAADLGRLAEAQAFPQAAGGLTEETIQQFILLGDPSMRVFTAVPQTLNVTHAQTLLIGARELTINVRRGTAPVVGADICVTTRTPGYYQVFRTDASGSAVFPVYMSAAATLDVTVTASNAVPYLGTVAVVSSDRPALELRAVRVSDPAGDNDALPDRGEACALSVQLQNLGGVNSYAGTLSVTATDPRISITPQVIPVPVINRGDSLWLTTTLPFTVADTVSDQALVLLTVVYISASGDSNRWIQPLTLHAPRLVFLGSVLIEDSGDGDGRAEGGERLGLHLRFRNSGSEPVREFGWRLFDVPPQVQIRAGSGSLPLLAAGDSVTVIARVQPAAGVAPGFPLEFTWRDSAVNIPLEGGWDRVRVGQVPVFLYVLDSQPQQVDAIAATLSALGVGFERGALLPEDLFRYASVWVFCGIFPNAVPLPAADAERLRQYLDGGGNAYWEGGDVWVFDPRTALHPYFQIRGISDGSADAGPVMGEDGSVLAGSQFAYSGENNFIDRLAADSGAVVLLRNARSGASYPLCVAYAGATYRAIGSSIELGFLVDGQYPSTRIRVVRDMLAFFGIACSADIQPPVIHAEILTQSHTVTRSIHLVADIQDASGIASAELRYHFGEGVIRTLPLIFADGLYHAALPAVAVGGTVHFRIRATDASPLHSEAETAEDTLTLKIDPRRPLDCDPATMSRAALQSHISGDGSWALTCYPERAPALELHGGGESVQFTTDPFDCSALQTATLSFWHYLRVADAEPAVARVMGSTDGGQTFPFIAWKVPRQGGGVLEEGETTTDNLAWMAGQKSVVLRFEFSGDWYWRLRTIRVSGAMRPRTAPVRNLVITVASPGVRLSWNALPAARGYAVLASPTMADSTFHEIFRTRDTLFVDLDDFFLQRYYEVVALLDEDSPVDLRPAAVPLQSAPLRLPDLRWNRKLSH